MDTGTTSARRSIPWNKAKLLGQKPPLKLKEIWAIRVRLPTNQGVSWVRILPGAPPIQGLAAMQALFHFWHCDGFVP